MFKFIHNDEDNVCRTPPPPPPPSLYTCTIYLEEVPRM